MTFDELLTQVLELLRRDGRVSYRALKRRFDLDEEYLEDLQALALAAELGMRPLQAHCHRGLGTLYLKTGQQEQAHAELSTAIALYRAMDMTFWLPETEADLAQVEGQ